MKKIVALTLLAAVSAGASAQSSVTLFGVLDVGVRHVKNGDNKLTTESSNGANTSRIACVASKTWAAACKPVSGSSPA